MVESAVPFPSASRPSRVSVRSVERPADAGWALVGGLDDERPTRVDGGGAVAPAEVSWSLDWWIGAEDRWHFPSREASVRQRRRGPGPIIETALRVPGGDITSTVYPVTVGRSRAVVVEVANRAKVPVTLAAVVRSISLDGRDGHRHRLELVDNRTVAIDARPSVLLPRSPNQAGAGLADSEGDPAGFPGRLTGEKPLHWDAPVAGPGAEAVMVYPLPHGTSLRFTVLGAAADNLDGLWPERLPDVESVERGWSSVLDQTCRIATPDPGLADLVDAARARLLIEAPRLPDAVAELRSGAGIVLSGLAAAGHQAECRPPLLHLASTFPTGLPDGPEAAAEVVAGVADAVTLCDDASLTESLLEPVMALVSLVERQGEASSTTRARLSLAALADRAGQGEAAAHIRGDLDSVQAAQVSNQRLPLETVMALAQAAATAGRWASPTDEADPDSAEAAARFWLVARRLLIDRPLDPAAWADPDGRPVVELLPAFPSAWLGGSLEVHTLAAAGARLSFAIRWHGYRPALLWEVDGVPVRLRCPGLDAEWSTTERTGEVLLTGSPDELPQAPAPGDSFA